MLIDESIFTLHGQTTSLPDEYEWVIPKQDNLVDFADALENRSEIRISRSQSLLKMTISVAQLTVSCITLYRTRGPQLDRYGYAAFGLSVFPYAFMSLVNLICIGTVGEYPCLLLLRTTILDEVKRRDVRISGEVGILKKVVDGASADKGGPAAAGNTKYTAAWLQTEGDGKVLSVKVNGTTKKVKLVDYNEEADVVFRVDSITNQEHCEIHLPHRPLRFKPPFLPPITLSSPPIRRLVKRIKRSASTSNRQTTNRAILLIKQLIAYIIIPLIMITPVLSFFLPYLLIFILTKFNKRESTLAERAWMMSWLSASQAIVLDMIGISQVDPNFIFLSNKESLTAWISFFLFFLLPLILLITPVIGGFVMVGKMLLEFGNCSLL